MTDLLAVAIIGAIPAGLSALAAIVAARGHAEVARMRETLVNVQINLDGRLDALLRATKAEGRLDERNQARDRDDAQQKLDAEKASE